MFCHLFIASQQMVLLAVFISVWYCTTQNLQYYFAEKCCMR